MKFSKLTLFILMAFTATFALGQAGKAPVNYLGVASPIVFNGNSFPRSWSSHPNGTYYKEEYMQKGEEANKFKKMILLEVVTGSLLPKDAAAGKIEELKQMKATNPYVNFEAFDNSKSGEYMIDFLVTAQAPDGKLSIAERNVYRYVTFKDKNGKAGLLLFGVSERSYGNEIDAFLVNLKKSKKTLVDLVAKFEIPTVTIQK